ncbi:MAG: hypothetical protein KBA66_07835 [Leptospiraceae bacterium]|nr:hypothetical protein [Leptospiraceae bacterium]
MNTDKRTMVFILVMQWDGMELNDAHYKTKLNIFNQSNIVSFIGALGVYRW